MDFIRCKSDEEKKAGALIDAGYDGGFNVAGGAYDSIYYQNANHSVRVTDSFMHSALADSNWETHSVTTGEVTELLKARAVLREMADAAHACGDPGIQYDTTINRWKPVQAMLRFPFWGRNAQSNTGRCSCFNSAAPSIVCFSAMCCEIFSTSAAS